jgi:hypothetical protein
VLSSGSAFIAGNSSIFIVTSMSSSTFTLTNSNALSDDVILVSLLEPGTPSSESVQLMLSFREGNISSALWSSTSGFFVVWNCKTSCDFNTSLLLIMFRCLGEIMSYENANILS